MRRVSSWRCFRWANLKYTALHCRNNYNLSSKDDSQQRLLVAVRQFAVVDMPTAGRQPPPVAVGPIRLDFDFEVASRFRHGLNLFFSGLIVDVFPTLIELSPRELSGCHLRPKLVVG